MPGSQSRINRRQHRGSSDEPARDRGRCTASPRCRQMETLLQLVWRRDCAILRTLRGSQNCGDPRCSQNGAHHDELGRPGDRDGTRRPGRAHGDGRSDLRHRAVALESPGCLADARQPAPIRRSTTSRFTLLRQSAALIARRPPASTTHRKSPPRGPRADRGSSAGGVSSSAPRWPTFT